MSRCVIIGGAGIGNYDAVRQYLKEGDFNIFCDCGLRHQEDLGIQPHLIVGDFDSFLNPSAEIETIVLPCEKDDIPMAAAVSSRTPETNTQHVFTRISCSNIVIRNIMSSIIINLQ